jgi:DNA polymerase III gamma/tau subunit
MSNELYKKFRPKTFKSVVGQEAAVAVLSKMVKGNNIPHTILFSGPSGCGKTTLARIVKEKLLCADADFNEVNCADFNGIAMVREIRNRLSLSPIGGPCRIWLIDECHQLTGDAQDAFLKILEDTPNHVYFLLATTNPQKLKSTIRTRCTDIKVESLSAKDVVLLLDTVAKKEKKEVSNEVFEKIAEHCEGSARMALVLLNQVIDLDDEDQQLNVIIKADVKVQAILLARALMNPKTKWPEVSKILKEIDEDVESLRHMVLGYTSSCVLNNHQPARCYLILTAFRDAFYDSKKGGLIAACYEVISS